MWWGWNSPPGACPELCNAKRTCIFQDMREIYQEEKRGDIQALQRSNAPGIYAGEKNCEKSPWQLLCRVFHTSSSSLRLPTPQKGQQARISFRHMHSYVTLTNVISIQEIHLCVSCSDCNFAETARVSGFVGQIHPWTTLCRCRHRVLSSVSRWPARGNKHEANPQRFKLKICHVFSKSYSWEMSFLKK